MAGFITGYIGLALTLLLLPIAIPNFVRAREVAMKNTIPGAQIMDFEGDGHALFVDDPEKFDRVLEEFVQSLHK